MQLTLWLTSKSTQTSIEVPHKARACEISMVLRGNP